jgi:hypothetical protein
MVLDFELVLGVRFISEYATRYGFREVWIRDSTVW